MCLLIDETYHKKTTHHRLKRIPKAITCKYDLLCYKTLEVVKVIPQIMYDKPFVSDDDVNETPYRTPYEFEPVTFDGSGTARLSDKLGVTMNETHYYEVGEGIHGFLYEIQSPIFTPIRLTDDEKYEMHKCVIPKGSKMYFGAAGDLVASSMIIFKDDNAYYNYKNTHEVKELFGNYSGGFVINGSSSNKTNYKKLRDLPEPNIATTHILCGLLVNFESPDNIFAFNQQKDKVEFVDGKCELSIPPSKKIYPFDYEKIYPVEVHRETNTSKKSGKYIVKNGIRVTPSSNLSDDLSLQPTYGGVTFNVKIYNKNAKFYPCVIPVGSMWYYGMDDDLISDKVIVFETMADFRRWESKNN